MSQRNQSAIPLIGISVVAIVVGQFFMKSGMSREVAKTASTLSIRAVAMILLGVVGGVFGQLSLKAGMARAGDITKENFFQVILSRHVLLGMFLYSGGSIGYLYLLQHYDLSLIYPMVALGYALTTLLSRLLFLEQVRLIRWLGVGIIVLGVVCVGFSHSPAVDLVMNDPPAIDSQATEAGFLGRLLSGPVLLGYLLYGLSAIAWLKALARAELSFAYPFLSIALILIVLESWAILGEALSPLRLVGVATIASGVILVGRS